MDALHSILSSQFTVTTFGCAEDCLQQLATACPDMFLLDIALPGMDGYDLCRRIKADSRFAHTPVTFVSSKDTIEERLAGYDAGGEDFVIKPFEADEIQKKVQVARQIAQNDRSLKEQIEASEYLSSLIIAGMDEAGLLLQFMSKLIAWDNPHDIATGLLELMQRYQLNGVVQTRTAQTIETSSANGVNLPLEISIINHVCEMGRIFEFHNHSVHNFERVTVMVRNLPLDQPEYCGRLRDHLSTAAQSVDARLKEIETAEENQRNQAVIGLALESISATLMSLRGRDQSKRIESLMLIETLNDQLLDSFMKLGLSDRQESYVQNLIGEFTERMSQILVRGAVTQYNLQNLNDELALLISADTR